MAARPLRMRSSHLIRLYLSLSLRVICTSFGWPSKGIGIGIHSGFLPHPYRRCPLLYYPHSITIQSLDYKITFGSIVNQLFSVQSLIVFCPQFSRLVPLRVNILLGSTTVRWNGPFYAVHQESMFNNRRRTGFLGLILRLFSWFRQFSAALHFHHSHPVRRFSHFLSHSPNEPNPYLTKYLLCWYKNLTHYPALYLHSPSGLGS